MRPVLRTSVRVLNACVIVLLAAISHGQPDQSFQAFDAVVSSSGPTDPEFAIGSAWIVGVTNDEIGIFAKNVASPNPVKQTWTQFFPGIGPGSIYVDPVVHYDVPSQRFFVVLLEQAYSTNAHYLHIAITDDANPNTFADWIKPPKLLLDVTYTDPSGGYQFLREFDFPRMCITNSNVYINGHYVDGSFPTFFNVLFVFDKSALLSNTFSPNALGFLPDRKSVGAVQAYGNYLSTPYWLEASRLPGPNTSIVLHAIDQIVNGTVLYASATIPTQPYASPTAPFQYPGGTLDPIDARFASCIQVYGMIWAVHNIQKPDGRTVVRWYKIDPDGWPLPGSQPSILASGDIDDPALDEYTFMPSIAANQLGHAAITYSRCLNSEPLPGGPTNQPAMWRVLKCAESANFGPQTLVKDSIPIVVPNPGGRWGDGV